MIYVCAYVLEYEDRTEGRVLHTGTKESCQRLAGMLPAVAVNDSPKNAFMVVIPEDEWKAAVG